MNPFRLPLLACFSLAAVQLSIAQPDTDIFLAPVEWAGGKIRMGEATNVTKRPGYDNQPQFLGNNSGFLFSSYRNGQADIYLFSLEDRVVSRVTDTPESEYSPTPARDGDGFTVVRVEADSTQRIWRFDANGKRPQVVLDEIHPVGYYALGFENTVALFVLGDPPSLQIADVASGVSEVVATDIGRSLRKIPLQRAVSFFQRKTDGWSIERYDIPTGNISPLTVPLQGSLDHAWLPDGTHILMARGPAIYSWEPTHRTWTPVADFRAQGISGITRLAVSPDSKWLAFVAAEH